LTVENTTKKEERDGSLRKQSGVKKYISHQICQVEDKKDCSSNCKSNNI
jgi:hypothetical protein